MCAALARDISDSAKDIKYKAAVLCEVRFYHASSDLERRTCTRSSRACSRWTLRHVVLEDLFSYGSAENTKRYLE